MTLSDVKVKTRDYKTIATTLWSLCLVLVGVLGGFIFEGGRLTEHSNLPAHREAEIILQQISSAQREQSSSIEQLKVQVSTLTVEIRALRADFEAFKSR